MITKKTKIWIRTYKGVGLASVLMGTAVATNSAHANVIDNGNGTTTLENGKASITLDSDKVKIADKTATELYLGGGYSPEKVTSGTDTTTLKVDNEIKYTLEDGTEIDDKVTNTTEKTVNENYDITGKSGKKYKGDDTIDVTADKTTGKKDTINKNGKTYRYIRTDVDQTGTVGAKDIAHFNDVNAKATVQGMHKTDGSIDYSKIKGRVWLIEEKEDGTYGKFKLIENGVGLTDERVAELSKEATGRFSQAEVDKLGGMKDTDTVLVYETNTYAAVKKERTLINSDIMFWGYSGSNGYFPNDGISGNNPDDVKKWLDSLVFPEFEKRNGRYYYKGEEVIWDITPNNKENYRELEWARFYELVGDVVASGHSTPELNNSWNMDNEINGYALFESYIFSLIARENEVDAKGERLGTTTYRNLKSGLLSESNGRPLLDRVTDTNVNGLVSNADSIYKMIDSAYNKENLRKMLKMYQWTFKDMDENYFGNYLKPQEIDSIRDDELTIDMWRDLIGYTSENGKYKFLSENESKRFAPHFSSGWGYREPTRSSLDIRPGSGNERFWEFWGEFNSTINLQKLKNPEKSGVLVSRDSYGRITEDKKRELNQKYGKENVDRWIHLVEYSWLSMYYKPYRALVDNRETFTYHDQVTPLRAYRLNSDKTVIRHVYEEVKKGTVVTNYYIENTTTPVAESNKSGDLLVGTNYETQPATPSPKVEKEDLEDRTITRTTKYELVKTPDNARGNIVEGETVVNYYYRPVTTEEVVMKEFKDIVTYHSETRYDVQHVFDTELEKDVKGFDNNSIFLHQKYGTKTEIARRVYDAALGFGNKKGYYPPISKIREAENNFARMLGYESREDYLKHNKDAIFDLTERPLFQVDNTDATIQSDLTTGFTNLSGDLADFRTRGVFGDLDVFEQKDTNVLNTYESRLPNGAELELTKITYNIDGGEEKVLPTKGFSFSRDNGTMQKDKTTHYTYHYKLKKREEVTNTENLTGSVVVKYITTDGQEIKDAVTIQKNAPAGQRVTKSIMSGTANLGSKTEVIDGTTNYDANTVKENRIEKNGKVYVLTRVLPKDNRFNNTENVTGIVKEGLTTIVYEYKEVEKARVIANYYKDGTKEKLADSEILPEQEVGTKYTTSPKVIDPVIDVQVLPDKIVTTKTIWTLKEIPSDKDGTVPTGGKEVNYYYTKRVETIEVPKPVEPTRPHKPQEPTRPTTLTPEPSVPISPTEPSPIGKEPTEPKRPMKSESLKELGDGPIKPLEPKAPSEPIRLSKPGILPITPVEPVAPRKPGQPTIGNEPKAPTNKPVEPTKPMIPTEPKKPLEPKLPIAPRKPLSDKTDPSAPQYPLNKPTEPVQPLVPKKPVEPTQPAGPTKPIEPVQPVLPEPIDIPKAPTQGPEVPQQPTRPIEPTEPKEPRKPQEPEKPKELPTAPVAPIQPKELPKTGDASLASLGVLAGLSALGSVRKRRNKH